MIITNGYSDGSGKGRIVINEKAVLTTHWGCGCCDYFDDSNTESKEMKLAELIVKILNKHKKELKSLVEKESK